MIAAANKDSVKQEAESVSGLAEEALPDESIVRNGKSSAAVSLGEIRKMPMYIDFLALNQQGRSSYLKICMESRSLAGKDCDFYMNDSIISTDGSIILEYDMAKQKSFQLKVPKDDIDIWQICALHYVIIVLYSEKRDTSGVKKYMAFSVYQKDFVPLKKSNHADMLLK